MIEVVFAMTLVIAGASPPPHQEKMESLDACLKKVEAVTKDFAQITDQTFTYAAGCVLHVRKADPA